MYRQCIFHACDVQEKYIEDAENMLQLINDYFDSKNILKPHVTFNNNEMYILIVVSCEDIKYIHVINFLSFIKSKYPKITWKIVKE
jgi:hypothetical protein